MKARMQKNRKNERDESKNAKNRKNERDESKNAMIRSPKFEKKTE